MVILIRSDFSEAFAEFDRLESLPGPSGEAKLDAVLDLGFETARTRVHVQTGSLKASGKKKSSSTSNTWRGQFGFGGPSTGIHTKVDYAIYEREREGSHDFFSQVFLLKSMFTAAMVSILRKKK